MPMERILCAVVVVAAASGCAAPPDVSDTRQGTEIGEAKQDAVSINGFLCTIAWDALSAAGCRVVQDACPAGSRYAIDGFSLPCDLATQVACGVISAYTGQQRGGCPR